MGYSSYGYIVHLLNESTGEHPGNILKEFSSRSWVEKIYDISGTGKRVDFNEYSFTLTDNFRNCLKGWHLCRIL